MNFNKHGVNAYKQQIKPNVAKDKAMSDGLDIKISKKALKQHNTSQKENKDQKPVNIMPDINVSQTAIGQKPKETLSKKLEKIASKRFDFNQINLLINNQIRNVDKETYEGKLAHRKCAELLLALGKEEADKVLSFMSVKEIQSVVKEIVQIQNERTRIKNSGGTEVAKGFLKVAFGEEESLRILQNATSDGNELFQNLNSATNEQIVAVLKDETIETIAIVLARIKPTLAKSVLLSLNKFDQAELVKRITQNKKIDASILFKIEDVLEKRLKKLQEHVVADDINVDGKRALADILRHLDSTQEQNIIDNINLLMPEISEELEENMFNLDTLLLVRDRDLQDILADINETDIAILVRGKSTDIRQKIFKNISSGRKELIRDEEDELGPLKKSVVELATKEFLAMLKEKEKKGEVVLIRDNFEDEYI